MVIDRKRCGYVVFAGSFAYLIYFHAFSASGEAWKAGNIDITGLLMVLTLKVTACALNYQDSGTIAESERNDFQRRRAVETLPGVIEYAGWLMFPCTLVVGPAIEFRDYHDWLHKKGVWGGKGCPSVWGRCALLVAYSQVFAAVHMIVMQYYTLGNTYLGADWNDKSVLRKFWELHILGQGSRGKYFFCWVWAEAACVAAGIGFSGYDSESGAPTWSGCTNVRPMGVEKAATFVEIPHHWNVQTGTWLRHYVYDRTTPRGKKPGFKQILITQVVSGVWHGLYAGYWLFFVSSAVFLQGSKSMFRWQRAHWPRRWNFVLDFPHWLLMTVGLNYLCGAFMLVTYEQCMAAWGSVYFIPHWIVLFMLVFGETFKGKRKPRATATAEVKTTVAVERVATNGDAPVESKKEQ